MNWLSLCLALNNYINFLKNWNIPEKAIKMSRKRYQNDIKKKNQNKEII